MIVQAVILSTDFESISELRRVGGTTLSWILDSDNAPGIPQEVDGAIIEPDQNFDIFISRIEAAVWHRSLVEQFGSIDEWKLFYHSSDRRRQEESGAAGENYGNLPMIRRKTE
ncbi:MAG TPA: hypothetical protein VN753_00905 [Terracidiphilus sp.]|nr:hypothetical protein [Terracidiphilus sp.]